ncbi:hypothetical protein BJP37_12820 [Moorena bouillonii PNG]|uniref:Transmembrane protein n=1 Tax=Moorena bouillonii PNG TaxID=568701 RepID=A0A1U7N1G3_9CYAN|nr:hypothetical protein BJP37_12820 [Moorena bouillonii PNG]
MNLDTPRSKDAGLSVFGFLVRLAKVVFLALFCHSRLCIAVEKKWSLEATVPFSILGKLV